MKAFTELSTDDHRHLLPCGGYMTHTHEVPPPRASDENYPDYRYDPHNHTHLVVLSARNYIHNNTGPAIYE